MRSTERVLIVTLMAAGGAIALAVAHDAGIKSWLDAKSYLVAGVLGGFIAGWLLTKVRK